MVEPLPHHPKVVSSSLATATCAGLENGEKQVWKCQKSWWALYMKWMIMDGTGWKMDDIGWMTDEN